MILISQTKSRKLNKLREWPQDFINIVTSLNEMRYPTPHHSQFKFEMSALAAEHNRKILSQYENLGGDNHFQKHKFPDIQGSLACGDNHFQKPIFSGFRGSLARGENHFQKHNGQELIIDTTVVNIPIG